jgi:TetR/AcrR family transcriptional regulator, copper-responsive repressor
MKRANGKPAMPRGRPRSFDREAALERAIDVFWRHGYEATSVSDLTAAMGINPPSLYAAFGDKEKLFLEAIERYQQQRRQSLTKIFDAAPTAEEAVHRVLQEAARELAGSSHPRGCLLVMSDTNCSDAASHVQSDLAQRRAAMKAGLKARIDRGAAAGELPRGTDTAALAEFYSTVFQGMAMQARDGATPKRLLATAEAAMRAWPRAVKRS